MSAVQPAGTPDDVRARRIVRGVITLQAEYEDTAQGALRSWRDLVEMVTDDWPSMYAFVRPGSEEWSPEGQTHRQYLVAAAIEYVEMEYADGVALTADQRERLRRVVEGLELHPLSPANYRDPMPEDRTDSA